MKCYCWCILFQVLSAATVIAKHTSALCNSCKAASAKTDNPVAKRHFVQSAKDVANNTANLVKHIKVSISKGRGSISVWKMANFATWRVNLGWYLPGHIKFSPFPEFN